MPVPLAENAKLPSSPSFDAPLSIPEATHLQPFLYPENPYWGEHLRAINDQAWIYRRTFVTPDEDYLRARLRRREDGELEAICHGKQDSSQMKIFARSDGLIVRPSHSDALEAGDRCTVLALRDM